MVRTYSFEYTLCKGNLTYRSASWGVFEEHFSVSEKDTHRSMLYNGNNNDLSLKQMFYNHF